MGKIINLVGRKFGKLKVLRHCGRERIVKWKCLCECGNIKIIRGGDLKAGKIKSCGCSRYDSLIKRNTTHGQSKTRLYRIWRGLFKRCYNKNSTDFKNYGARGISIYQNWKKNFIKFYNWSYENGYKDNLTIERVNNDKGYYPSNCKWITKKEQSANKRKRTIFPKRNDKGMFIKTDNPSLLEDK